MKAKIDVSFVIPVKDEEKTIKTLFSGINKTIKGLRKTSEVIFVDDGSTDNSFEEMLSLKKKYKNIKIIKHRGNWGKSIALQNGFSEAVGSIIFTMDADLQDDPNEIPKFIKKIDSGYDLVSGWKKIRHDPLSKTFPSKIGNIMTRFLTKVSVHDLNCGFKAYRSEVAKNLNLHGELYKYIPVLAEKQNFKVGEVIVTHKKRRFGKSKFGWERNIKGFLDMLTIVFITGYLKRPAHFFGTWGLISFAAGFIIGIDISYLRITTGSIQYHYPLLFLGLLLMIVGVQLVSTGLLAEMFINPGQTSSYDSCIDQKLV